MMHLEGMSQYVLAALRFCLRPGCDGFKKTMCLPGTGKLPNDMYSGSYTALLSIVSEGLRLFVGSRSYLDCRSSVE